MVQARMVGRVRAWRGQAHSRLHHQRIRGLCPARTTACAGPGRVWRGRRPADRVGSRGRQRIRARVLRGRASPGRRPLPRLRVGLLLPAGRV